MKPDGLTPQRRMGAEGPAPIAAGEMGRGPDAAKGARDGVIGAGPSGPGESAVGLGGARSPRVAPAERPLLADEAGFSAVRPRIRDAKTRCTGGKDESSSAGVRPRESVIAPFGPGARATGHSLS